MGSIRLSRLSVDVRKPRNPDEQAACHALRWEVLRAPWHQPRGSECDELETLARHYLVANPQGRVLATGRIHSCGTQCAQIRYMAVHPDFRGRGLGRLLLAALETDAGQHGETRIILHAREHSLEFYHHCGYRVIRKSHRLFGTIQHYEMEKYLPVKPRQVP